MSDNKIIIRKQTSTTIDLDHESLGHGLHVFRRRALTEVSFPGNPDLDTSVLEEDQGIVDDENLALLREGLEADTCGEAYQIMPKFIREELAKKGWDYWRHEGDRGDLISPTHGVYDGFIAGEWSVEDMVRENIRAGRRVLEGLDGTLHPVAIKCSPREGTFDASLYDMDRLVHEVLSKRSDITFTDTDGNVMEDNRPTTHPFVRKCELVQGAHFLWQIDQETLAKVVQVTEEMAHGEEKDPYFWSAAFECDALGLREAGIAHRETYFKEGEMPTSWSSRAMGLLSK
jgi:hypothetical protein